MTQVKCSNLVECFLKDSLILNIVGHMENKKNNSKTLQSTVGYTVMKNAGQRSLPRLGSLDSVNVTFSPKKNPTCGISWLVK